MLKLYECCELDEKWQYCYVYVLPKNTNSNKNVLRYNIETHFNYKYSHVFFSPVPMDCSGKMKMIEHMSWDMSRFDICQSFSLQIRNKRPRKTRDYIFTHKIECLEMSILTASSTVGLKVAKPSRNLQIRNRRPQKPRDNIFKHKIGGLVRDVNIDSWFTSWVDKGQTVLKSPNT